MALTTVWIQPFAAQAVPPASEVSGIDDFEDNDAGDWGFFGGNAAGGGGGTADDRPKEGSYYFSTGWGGNGTASGFYGGAFKNFDNAGQVAVPADPWFNVWIYQQSDTTVDQYTLELTLREDTDGDGWTSGAEDSIGLDTTFTTSDFDDRWKLLSAPLSSFVDRGTGGNGVFDGDLDEVVIVFGGVQGVVGSVIEIDFDQFVLTPDGPLAFDDMEHGDPFGNGWFAFGGSVGGGGIGSNFEDLPPANGGAFSLQTGWGSGGAPGFFGGFGRTNPRRPVGHEPLQLLDQSRRRPGLHPGDQPPGGRQPRRRDQPARRRRVPVQLHGVARGAVRGGRRWVAARVDPARRLRRRQLVPLRRQRCARRGPARRWRQW